MGMRRGIWIGGLVAACALALAGCTGGQTGTAPAETSTASCPPVSTGDTSDVVTPEQLCAEDGRPWESSVYTFIVNTPVWVSSAECDTVRRDSYWASWAHVQDAIETIDLNRAADPERLEGSVGIALLDDAVTEGADPIAALDAEVATCAVGDEAQQPLEHGPWRGISGPTQQDGGDVRASWWADAGDRWVLVQAYRANGITEAEAADAETAVTTVLDVQAAALGL